MHHHELFHRQTRALILGNELEIVPRMLDFDLLCHRELPSVAGMVKASPACSALTLVVWVAPRAST